MSKILESIKESFRGMIDNDNFFKYITKPLDEGKCYHIGDITELIDITNEISTFDIDEMISEKLMKITEDLFVLQYIPIVSEKYKGSEACVTIICHKISPDYLFIIGFVSVDTDIAMNPCYCIIPLCEHSINYRSQNFIVDALEDMKKSGVNENFLFFLSSIDYVFTLGDIAFFYLYDENEKREKKEIEDVANDLKDSAIDIVYRFFILKAQGEEIKVSPNTDLEFKGYTKLLDRSRTYYLLKSPMADEYLGFTKRSPDE